MNTQTRIFLAYLFPIILALGFFVALLVTSVFLYGNRLFLLSTDFRAFYTAGRMLSNGAANDFYNLDTQYFYQHGFAKEVSQEALMPFLNPPFAALPFALLSFLPLGKSYLVWLFLNLVLLVFFLKSILKLIRSLPQFLQALTIVLILLFLPLLNGLMLGQFSLLLAFSVSQAYFALKSDKNFSAGLWLSLLLIRPHLVIVPALALLAGRRFRAFLGLILGSSILFLISLLLVGLDGLFGYINLLTAAFSWGDAHTVHPQLEPTWRGFLQTLTNSDYVGDIQVWWIVGVVFAVGILVWVWSRYQGFSTSVSLRGAAATKQSLAEIATPRQVGTRNDKRSAGHDFDLSFALMIIVMIFVSPHTNYHDLTLFIVPGVLIVNYLSQRKKFDMQDKLLFILVYIGYVVITIVFQTMAYNRLHLAAPFMILAMAVLGLRAISFKRNLISEDSENSVSQKVSPSADGLERQRIR